MCADMLKHSSHYNATRLRNDTSISTYLYLLYVSNLNKIWTVSLINTRAVQEEAQSSIWLRVYDTKTLGILLDKTNKNPSTVYDIHCFTFSDFK
jgi:hypothetical protein